ncbi:hypothetical protein HPC49_38085 [Pyxidicoccus fallax]|uniref:Uncharacterized protein n=1 Tax=Pyxidicoccus fallax TaxID=394095 RepID=A0A848LSA3_9BACT|nr:hypothetical protein [Pyxidicoccus fallax]NMO20571.1 hypothetical protein [Pyxidicoccus fallax]NPC84012.1 hypothetical protein [Pyxidicoccus fallax]
MSWVAAATWETRHALRQLLPWRWARWLLVLLVLALGVGLSVLVLFIAPPSPRPLEVGVVAGFMGFNLLLATGAAGVGLSRLVARPRGLWLLSLSPMGERSALRVALAPTLLAALCPVTLVGLPFALLASRVAPAVAASMVVAGVCALGWALLGSVSLATLLGQRLGKERGARVLAALSGWLAFMSMMAFGALVRLDLGTPTLVMFLVLTPLLLPVLWERALRAFLDMLRGTETPRTAPEPAWGRGGWARLVGRSSWGLALLALVPVTVVGYGQPSLRRALCALLAVQGVSAVLELVLEPELSMPDRLRLAPRGAVLRARLLAVWGLAALVPALALCALVGWGRWTWLATLAGAGALVPFTYFIRPRGARVVCQLLLLAVALAMSGSETVVAVRGD